MCQVIVQILWGGGNGKSCEGFVWVGQWKTAELCSQPQIALGECPVGGQQGAAGLGSSP